MLPIAIWLTFAALSAFVIKCGPTDFMIQDQARVYFIGGMMARMRLTAGLSLTELMMRKEEDLLDAIAAKEQETAKMRELAQALNGTASNAHLALHSEANAALFATLNKMDEYLAARSQPVEPSTPISKETIISFCVFLGFLFFVAFLVGFHAASAYCRFPFGLRSQRVTSDSCGLSDRAGEQASAPTTSQQSRIQPPPSSLIPLDDVRPSLVAPSLSDGASSSSVDTPRVQEVIAANADSDDDLDINTRPPTRSSKAKGKQRAKDTDDEDRSEEPDATLQTPLIEEDAFHQACLDSRRPRESVPGTFTSSSSTLRNRQLLSPPALGLVAHPIRFACRVTASGVNHERLWTPRRGRRSGVGYLSSLFPFLSLLCAPWGFSWVISRQQCMCWQM
ncbi:hypothetical protein FPV67DRAFT_1529400, partial [Lyophyllum atratum]